MSQIIAGALLLYNRTVLIGASLSIPILLNILMIDITYIKMPAFYYRLSYYLLLTFLILWHYRERIMVAVQALMKGLTTRFKYPFWAYLILPIMAIALEILPVIPHLLYSLITDPTEFMQGVSKMFGG